ncbi:MAG TPA: response regulator transcription factor [Anaerolineae bacterium]|nr:response regulator transcription factor [Anaerolineae bacterium]
MNETTHIRVLIADDHAVVRNGLRFFLLAYDNLEPVGEASSGEDCVTLCGQLRPDVVLMDLMMPGIGGVAAIRAIRQQYPNTHVIALTSFVDDQTVQAALKAGAISYLLKNVSADELADAIQAAYSGRATLAPEATQALVHSITETPAPGYDLTPREKEVLNLMIGGLNNQEIGMRLVIGLSTVKFHVSGILSKLGVASRAEAVAVALQRRLWP